MAGRLRVAHMRVVIVVSARVLRIWRCHHLRVVCGTRGRRRWRHPRCIVGGNVCQGWVLMIREYLRKARQANLHRKGWKVEAGLVFSVLVEEVIYLVSSIIAGEDQDAG